MEEPDPPPSSEPDNAPEGGPAGAGDAAAPRPHRRRPWYDWRLTWLAAILLGLIAGALSGVWFTYEYRPRWLVIQGLRIARLPAEIGDVSWSPDGSLVLRDIRVGDYLRAASVEINWDWRRLIDARQIASVRVQDPRIWIGRMEEALAEMGAGSAEGGPTALIRQVEIRNAVVVLDNLGPNIPTIPVTLGRRRPLIFRDIFVGDLEASPSLDDIQTVELEDIMITSPFDAISPVFTFEFVQMTFTWRELFHNRIRELKLISPIMYLGPDLFWFVDSFSKQSEQTDGLVEAFLIDHFEVFNGKLAINAFGVPGVVLPFQISSDARNINLAEPEELTIHNVLRIQKQDIVYPAYKIKLLGVEGQIDFALPLSDPTTDNVVPTITLEEASWNDIGVKDAWASVTFERRGIFGKLGGKSYGGYVSANFEIFFDSGFPWSGQIFAEKVNVQQPIAQLAPSYLELTGTADGKLEVKGRATDIEKCDFRFEMRNPGELQIKSIDDLRARIPADWPQFKQLLTNRFLDAFRHYQYQTGHMQLTYGDPLSVGKLELRGPQGNRTINVRWTQKKLAPSADDANGDADADTDADANADADAGAGAPPAASAPESAPPSPASANLLRTRPLSLAPAARSLSPSVGPPSRIAGWAPLPSFVRRGAGPTPAARNPPSRTPGRPYPLDPQDCQAGGERLVVAALRCPCP